MFNSLGKKLTLTLSITLAVFVIFTSIILYYIISKSIYTSYVKTSIQYIHHKFENLQIYMGLVEETSKLLCNNSTILSALEEQKNRTDIATILDGINSTYNDFSAVGIYLYSINGIEYSTSNITNMPHYDDIISSMDLDKFLSSEQDSVWVIRDSNISETIAVQVSDSYKTTYGLLTYVLKIYDNLDNHDNNNIKGLLVVNVDIMKLYNLFKSNNPDFFGQANSYILHNHKILPYPSVSQSISSETSNRIVTNSKKHESPIIYENNIISYHNISDYSNTILVILMPISPFLTALNTVIMIFTAVSLIFIIYFIIISNIISKSITLPLNSLNKKMKTPLK